MITTTDLVQAHDACYINRKDILLSDLCGCCYCVQVYAPTEITEWVDKKQTALCPKCGIDAVLPYWSNSSFMHRFLKRMNTHWFSRRIK